MEMLKNIPQLAARVFRQERIHDTGTMREPQLREAKAPFASFGESFATFAVKPLPQSTQRTSKKTAD
jgi:hypothetical protein